MAHDTPFPRPRLSGKAKPPHLRRGVTTYKVAQWDARSFCWRDGRSSHETFSDAVAEAQAAAKRGAAERFRISTICDGHRADGKAFVIDAHGDTHAAPSPDGANAVYPTPKP